MQNNDAKLELTFLVAEVTNSGSIFDLSTRTDEQTREIRYELRQNLGSIQLDKHNRPSKKLKKLGRIGIVCGNTTCTIGISINQTSMGRFVLYALWHDISILPMLPEHRICIHSMAKGMAKALGYYQ